MKKLIFIILASILFASCETGNEESNSSSNTDNTSKVENRYFKTFDPDNISRLNNATDEEILSKKAFATFKRYNGKGTGVLDEWHANEAYEPVTTNKGRHYICTFYDYENFKQMKIQHCYYLSALGQWDFVRGGTPTTYHTTNFKKENGKFYMFFKDSKAAYRYWVSANYFCWEYSEDLTN